MIMRLSLLSFCLVIVAVSTGARADAAIRRTTYIASQELAPALQSLARERRIQVVYRSEFVSDRRTSGAAGNLTLEEALTQLLSGTGLTFRYLGEKAITIVPTSSADSISQRTGKSFGDEVPLHVAFAGEVPVGEAVETISGDGSSPNAASIGSAPRSASSLEEVVVTATKRSVRLQDVPLAISSLSGESLAAQGALDFVGYARSIPGLSFTDTGTGSQKVAIRGINPTIGSSTVAFYIGDTPMPASVGNFGGTLQNPKLVDMARVEVLRGPQGTLYGAGAVGGTIRLIPEPPNLTDFLGYVETGASKINGGGAGYDVTAVANIPIVKDELGLRIAAWHRSGDGFITNRFPGGSRSDMPHDESHGVRATVRFQPYSALEISAMLYFELQRANGFQTITVDSSNPNDALEQNFLADVAEPHENRFTLGSVTAKWTLDPVTLTSVTGYSDSRRRITEEGTALINAFFGGTPLANHLDESNSQGDFTQELRLATNRSFAGFDAILGGYYEKVHRSRTMRYFVPGFDAQYAPDGPSNPLFTPNDNLFSLSGTSFYRESSLFGELSYTLDKLKLTGGARHYDIKNGNDEALDGFFNGGPSINVPRGSFAGSVYKINASYSVTPQHLVFAQYTEGFRPGFGLYGLPTLCDADLAALGLNGQATQVNPDSVKSYEIGAKTSWLQRRLIVNASTYQMDWADVQTTVQLGCGYTITRNSQGGVRSRGIELETSMLVLPSVTVGLSASYTQSKFNEDEPNLGARQGDQLQDVPKWQYAIYSQYDFDISNGRTGFARVDLQDTAGSYVSFTRLADGVTRDPLSYKGETRLLNLRIGMDIGRWRFSLYGNNLLDNVVRQALSISSIADTPGRPRFVVNQPRTIGLDARFSF